MASDDDDADFVLDDIPQSTINHRKKSPLATSTNTVNGTSKNPKETKNGSASDNYQKLTQLEHILKRPDTYIGSVEKFESEQWIYNTDTDAMEYKRVNIVPGLFKIFDEILVNAADNKIRDSTMKKIDVKIDAENNLFSVKNDGRGIPIEIHDKEKMYIPELIFGNLLTSSNYNDNEKKVTGGRNGYGAKLCNIFSKEFIVKTADKSHGKVYTQTWHNNMSVVDKPVIKPMKNKSEYTEIIFKPDLEKFGMTHLDSDILGVLRRRVLDLCGSVRGIRVSLNGKTLKISNFKQYTELYVKALTEGKREATGSGQSSVKLEEDSNDSEATPIPDPPKTEKPQTIVYQAIDDRWEIAFSVSDGNFHQVSFVNSIATTSGGTHVEFITNMLVNKIMEYIKKKHRRAMLRPFQIKNNMFIFINCLIENPAFTSQTKEQLTTRPSQYGGKKMELPENFLKKVLASGILDQVLDIAEANADKALKKMDGSRKNRITGYPKLEDANRAGTREGYKCTLILTEGDSALTLAVAGLAVVGRNYYGCYPLRGKLLNVREASADQIMKNQEIQAIKQIMGLQHKKRYEESNLKSLRYGHLMIMADQDHDGSHIKGLIINFLETSFPGLLEVPNFLIEFITPIVKVTILRGPNKRKVIPFYNMPEYEKWRDTEGVDTSYKQKYYKGLGTSAPDEMREYFSKLDKHLKKFHALQEGDAGFIDLAFSKKKADDRKEWLRAYQPGTFLDPDFVEIPISDFINKELILYSMADNIRSIPSVVDGFKPSQRKILYGCYKRNLRGEIKVSQLEGYIAEHTGYHHGDASLIQTIVSLAQDFVGSNNLNLLFPHGGFGSRAAGGKDAAAARYIFTELSAITRKVFNPLDNNLLKYLKDDEQTVEPEWYVPVIPMVLVNGAEGIGSGWSTSIPSYNPEEIVENIQRLMRGEEILEMIPWYKGWEGQITKLSSDRYRIEGNIHQVDENTLEITELPVGMWTITMKEFLLKGLSGSERQKPWIKDMEEDHGVGIKFIVKLSDEEMAKTLKIGLKERFKLISTISTSNMVLFDPTGRIKKYENERQILEEYYHVRLDYYQRRKDFMVEELSNQLEKLSSQARFVKMIIERELVVSNKKRPIIVKELQDNAFPGFDKDSKPVRITAAETELEADKDGSSDDEEEVTAAAGAETGMVVNNSRSVTSLYDYLLGMQIWSLTRERYEKLLNQRDTKEAELTALLGKSAKDLWSDDLEEFLIAWQLFLKEDEERRNSMVPDAASNSGKKKRARKRKVKSEDATEPKPKKRAKAMKQSTLSLKKGGDDATDLKHDHVVKEEEVGEVPSTPFKSVFGLKKGKSSPFGGKFSAAFSAFNSSDSIKLEDDDQNELLGGPSDDVSKHAEPETSKKRARKSNKGVRLKKVQNAESEDDESDDDQLVELNSGEDEIISAVKRSRRKTPAKSYVIDAPLDDNEIVDDDDVVDLGDDSDDSYHEWE
ncbi:DEKNAAC103537 [Brettanomyces naardenensis]|uniref:DNA topoisomerase 2 n=1 Tax=Brettanomyces naardenensis TaxID=13370 RepID=A0A448YNJ5_BRENA|nr:DEKNAAC103537 [Brettanomyces naardenensis]